MILTDPSLILTFLGDDIQEGHASTQTIGKDGIINHSISRTSQLLSGLKPASNQVSISLHRDLDVIGDIIRTESDIKAQLLNGSEVLFTGYVSTSFSWSLTEHGEESLSLTLEDVGTRKLGAEFISTGHQLFNCIADTAIRAIAKAAGVTCSSAMVKLETNVVYLASGGDKCQDLLQQLLYELGYVYYFNEYGEMDLFKVDCTSTEGIPIIGKDNLYSVNGTAIKVSKKIRQYRAARVTYKSLGTVSNYLVYRNTSGKGDGHPYCYFAIAAGYSFDGSEIYQEEAGTDHVSPQIEAVNAESETEHIGSNEIVAISNIETRFAAQGNYIEASITEAGGPYMKIAVTNKGNLSYYVTRLDAYATVIFVKAENIVRTGDSVSDDSANLISEEISWIHDNDLATTHANRLASYWKCAGAEYAFYTKADLKPGDIVKISDEMFSGLEVSVLIFAKTETDESDVAEFRAVGISAFSLKDKVYIESLKKGNSQTKGEDGASPPAISCKYLASASSTGVTTETEGWTDIDSATQALGSEKPYLWQYEIYTLTNGDTLNSSPRVIRIYGAVSTQYTWWTSSTEEPADVIWYKRAELPAQTTSAPYLWWRISGDGGTTWEKPCFIGNDEMGFTLNADPSSYLIGSRGYVLTEQTINFTVDREKLPSSAVVSWSHSGSITFTESGNSATVVIPKGSTTVKFSVSATVTGLGTKTLTILAVPTGYAEWQYFGQLGYEPECVPDTGEPLMAGDCYMPTADIYDADGNQLATKRRIRRYDGSAWKDWTNKDSNYGAIVALAMSDYFADIPEGSTAEAEWGLFRNILSQYVSATVIQVLECIYGGSFNKDGTPISENASAGFHLSATGLVKLFKSILEDVTITSFSSTGRPLLQTRKGYEAKTLAFTGTFDVLAACDFIPETSVPVDVGYGEETIQAVTYKSSGVNFSKGGDLICVISYRCQTEDGYIKIPINRSMKVVVEFSSEYTFNLYYGTERNIFTTVTTGRSRSVTLNVTAGNNLYFDFGELIFHACTLEASVRVEEFTDLDGNTVAISSCLNGVLFGRNCRYDVYWNGGVISREYYDPLYALPEKTAEAKSKTFPAFIYDNRSIADCIWRTSGTSLAETLKSNFEAGTVYSNIFGSIICKGRFDYIDSFYYVDDAFVYYSTGGDRCSVDIAEDYGVSWDIQFEAGGGSLIIDSIAGYDSQSSIGTEGIPYPLAFIKKIVSSTLSATSITASSIALGTNSIGDPYSSGYIQLPNGITLMWSWVYVQVTEGSATGYWPLSGKTILAAGCSIVGLLTSSSDGVYGFSTLASSTAEPFVLSNNADPGYICCWCICK